MSTPHAPQFWLAIDEEYFTPYEISKLLRIHVSTAIRMFRGVEGVLRVRNGNSFNRPRYNLRIPYGKNSSNVVTLPYLRWFADRTPP